MILSLVFHFLSIISGYHILTTVCVYGWELCENFTFALFRELLRFGACFVIILLNNKKLNFYREKWKGMRYTTLILFLFAISISYLMGKGRTDIFIGIKYGFQWMCIFLSASFLGFCYKEAFSPLPFIKWIKFLLTGILILGFLRQGMKLLIPEWFGMLGYELQLDDYTYGEKPPLYYLTGYEGTLRWQGLFSGPNTYGFFLVVFFPLMLLFFGEDLRKRKQFSRTQWRNIGTLALWILAMILTLSRAVLIGGSLVIFFLYRSFFQQHKKIFLPLFIIGILGIGVLSLWKRDSTLQHLSHTQEALLAIVDHPRGQGLGTSGPAIHHNGTILPENHFFQILIDTGTLGFLIQISFLLQLFWMCKLLIHLLSIKTDQGSQLQFLLLKRASIGFIALLLMGFFLHSLEDSMVNYLFFVIYGLIFGVASTLLPKKRTFSIHSFIADMKGER